HQKTIKRFATLLGDKPWFIPKHDCCVRINHSVEQCCPIKFFSDGCKFRPNKIALSSHFMTRGATLVIYQFSLVHIGLQLYDFFNGISLSVPWPAEIFSSLYANGQVRIVENRSFDDWQNGLWN